MKLRRLALLIAALALLVLPSTAGSGPFYTAEQLLTATDLVDTKQKSRWISTPDFEGLACTLDVTAISGASAAVYIYIIGCDPPEVAAAGCVNYNDSTVWYAGTAVSTVTEYSLIVSRDVTSGIQGAAFDKDAWGPLPPVWAAYIHETGSTTVSYTLDCMWW